MEFIEEFLHKDCASEHGITTPDPAFHPNAAKKHLFSFLKIAAVGLCFLSIGLGLAAGGVWYMYERLRKEFEVTLEEELNKIYAALPAESVERIIEKTERVVEKEYIPQTSQEDQVIAVVEKVSPAVVSILSSKNQKGVSQEGGKGSGFFVNSDGLLITNKHVVLDKEAVYTVVTKDGSSYETTVLARDPVQDIAVLKVDTKAKPVSFIEFGDVNVLGIGQSVITIGNALGEFRNTVSLGVVSGLGRTITASDNHGFIETIEDVIQTDAAINRGNSGGPLLNLSGKVIGVNTATVIGAQSIGFAIPSDRAARDLAQVQVTGNITYASLVERYMTITPEVQKEKGLSVNYGALVLEGKKESAAQTESASPAVELRNGDILLEIDGKRLDEAYSLSDALESKKPGEGVITRFLRDGKEHLVFVLLGVQTG